MKHTDSSSEGEITSAPNMDILANALHYLPDAEMQKCRLVSAEWNAFISHYHTSFYQRPQLDYLSIGYRSNATQTPDWREWRDISRFQQCCKRELEPLVDSMVGKLMLPGREVASPCRVFLRLKADGAPIVLELANEFTRESAFQYLHLMKHLDDCVLDWVHFRCNGCPPIPSDFRCKIHCEHLVLYCCNRSLEYKEIADLFPPRETMQAVLPEVVNETLERIADAGRQPYAMILVVMISEHQQFNEAFEYFRHRDVRSIVAGVVLNFQKADGTWNRWPLAPFDPAAATKLEDLNCTMGCEHYSFSYLNTLMNEPYRAVVHIEPEKQIVGAVTLMFKK